MPCFHRKYYYHSEPPASEKPLLEGMLVIERHPLFGSLGGDVYIKSRHHSGKGSMATVDRKGNICLNSATKASPEEWAYSMAHCLLHLAFGHFDKENLPEDVNTALWAKACDIYIAQFLADTNFGGATVPDPMQRYSIKLTDEKKIYQHLIHEGDEGEDQAYSMNGSAVDMVGLEHPLEYGPNEKNHFTESFVYHLTTNARASIYSVSTGGAERTRVTLPEEAAQWFLEHFPLLGGLASGFRLIEDSGICQKNEIQIAAVDSAAGNIYVNPTAGLSLEEWKFVLAHEYLHAGLDHAGRCRGRDRYLWNVACDYVINDWLQEMNIGKAPDIGLLYDESLHGMSAEYIYDLIVEKIRKYSKLATFRGYGKGDIISGGGSGEGGNGIRLDDFFKNALREGLDYISEAQRGLIPAGLIEEIRALSAKPIPWDVALGQLFADWFPPLQRRRSYARASRRQGSTPDIPRPGYTIRDEDLENRTFGVIIDTSGSMGTRQIGYALGAVASYAVSKEVRAARVVFCDAAAYDAGYVSPEDIAGRVEVTGRGGTALQPAVDLLERERDFPDDAPILIITDGEIEEDLTVRRKHAYLLPKGNKLPYRAKGKVFYFDLS